MNFNDLTGLISLTARDPAQAIRQLQAQNIPLPALWMVLGVAVLLSTLLMAVAVYIQPTAIMPIMQTVISQPVLFAIIQFVAITTGIWMLSTLGRTVGGRAGFTDMLLGVTWIEVLFLLIQFAQTVMLVFSLLLASLFGLVATFFMIWVSVQIMKTLHGFSNSFLVFLGMIFAIGTTIIILSILVAALGLLPELPQEAVL